jgi:DUF971 family protein
MKICYERFGSNILKIIKLKQSSATVFEALWDDGHNGSLEVRSLRDNCPCASCSGETILMHSYVPPAADTSVPGRYDVRGIETVGGYALKFRWGDGHELGLYTWELLRSLCSCGCNDK